MYSVSYQVYLVCCGKISRYEGGRICHAGGEQYNIEKGEEILSSLQAVGSNLAQVGTRGRERKFWGRKSRLKK